MSVRILIGDVRDRLRDLPDESVHCVVTSPPYWGLRDYGTASWEGGDTECDHRKGPLASPKSTLQGYTGDHVKLAVGGMPFKEVCGKCGARRIDRQLGMEPTLGEHIETMVSVFREVRRVLRKDGTVWLNYGDCYATSGTRQGDIGGSVTSSINEQRKVNGGYRPRAMGLKEKDLCMIPNRLAIALQDDGWWVRSEIIWHKPNPMPESVTDRPATAHEKIWLLTKSARYWYDAEAVRTASNWDPSNTKMPDGWDTGPGAHGSVHRNGREKGARKTDKQRGHGRRHAGFNDRWDAMSKSEQQANGANLRNVWTVPTKGFSEAHFATFPPDLIVPCIKAGTSEKGCCAECGAPWVRETEARLVPTAKAAKRGIIDARDYAADKNDGGANRQKDGHIPGWRRDDITLGWSPSCKCHVMKGPISQTVGTPPDPVACTVMDPFGGSGTTGLVADRLGRNAILIELNPEYAEMAQRRITDDAGMFHTVEIEQRAEAAE